MRERSTAERSSSGILAGILVVACVACPLTARAQSESAPAQKAFVGILPFKAPAEHARLSDIATEELIKELGIASRYQLVEMARIRELMATIAQSRKPDYDARLALEIAKLCGARFMCFGEVAWAKTQRLWYDEKFKSHAFSGEVRVSLRVVSVEDGALVFDKVVTKDDADLEYANPPENLLGNCVKRAIRLLAREADVAFAVEGRVLAVRSKKEVLLNIGEADGVVARMKLIVLRSAGTLVDPATGLEVPKPEEEVGELVVDRVGPTSCSARVVKGPDVVPGSRVTSRPRGAGLTRIW